MVTTPDLAIAKAALTATLLRADPTSLSRAAIAEFLQLLDNTLDECSRPNVQKCKNWIVANAAASSGRNATLGKYLVALSESMETDFDRPSVRRRRLHVLYVASDVLHHVVTRQGLRDFSRAWEAHLPAVVAAASTFEKYPRHLAKVRDLIALWEERAYVPPALVTRIREAFTRASDKDSGTRIQMSSEALKLAKEAPFVLPASHGDASAPWSDLPAASWLAHLDPNSAMPMSRSLLRPIQLRPGPAKEALAKLVKATLSDADDLYRKGRLQERAAVDFTLLGEMRKPREASSATGLADANTEVP
ncbi:hypothetical protein CDD83_9036 [Cordyceps sp. RAO-2017]|nr:hypothetical protein CDD83_9036 [Cordyceps sp. RAO-2017]